ncbi:MAG: hypothetical protein MGG11_16070 [Trichodesmium sp. MAG_R03]|nr:hypothetical protein [Trichodesmium sp. MAG_R03]
MAIAILGFNNPVFGQTAEIIGRPIVKDDEITLRLQVTEDGERPAMLLEKQDFRAIVDNKVVDIISWKNPEETMQLFLNALPGEYKIVYREPNPERASKHEVFVTATVNGRDVDTTQKSYTINAFGRSLPRQIRLRMTGLVLLLLGLGGAVPFFIWSHRLKQETEKDF